MIEFNIRCGDDRRETAISKIEEFAKNGRGVFIYGAGRTASHITQLLKEHISTEIRYVVDDEYLHSDCFVPREKVLSFTEFYEKYRNTSVLVIGFDNYLRGEAFISKYKSEIENIFHIPYIWLFGKPILWNRYEVDEKQDSFKKTFELLSDNKSKETMIEYIQASLTGELDNLLCKYQVKEQYFNELTDCENMETFVDCGAYDGDTVEDFRQFYKNYGRIIAFEPDPDNVKRLCEKKESDGIENLEIYRSGVYSRSDILTYSSDAKSSGIDENGSIRVEVVKLDEVLENEPVSMIKMDIEGSELEALKGAAQTIKRCHPILAICVYHKTDDLITIPQYIHSISENKYDYFLRHHGNNLTELVFYAIPKSN